MQEGNCSLPLNAGEEKTGGHTLPPHSLPSSFHKNSPLDKSEYREVEGRERGSKEQGGMLDTGVHEEKPGP